jgi:hypothetical protein
VVLGDDQLSAFTIVPVLRTLAQVESRERNRVAEGSTIEWREQSDSFGTLGLRWAAIRGMLNSPLIFAHEHDQLRADLAQELAGLERQLAEVPCRSGAELAAKLDIARSAIRWTSENAWIADVLDSLKEDVRLLSSRPQQHSTRAAARLGSATNVPGLTLHASAPK